MKRAGLAGELSEAAREVLERRYLARDEEGRLIEDADGMFRRAAAAVAEVEERPERAAMEEAFYRMMARLDFLPNTPALANAGRSLGQLAACFVLPIEDSMESIFGTLRDAALVQKSGGGTGFSFSRLRPRGDPISTTGGVSSGPVSFMRLYDFASEVTKLGGIRSGANMAVLSVDHPDILEFIHLKDNPSELLNFNVSVALPDAFMGALERGGSFPLINPRTGRPVKELSTETLFAELTRSAWQSGEPGVIFIDRINRTQPTPALGQIEATNPCGEQPLLPYESCNLGSIQVARFVREGDFDWERLGETVRQAVRFLDNVIDASRYPLPAIAARTRETRKIGLGVMGFADALVELGIAYWSEEAARVGEKLMRFIHSEGRRASAELAARRGAFPAFASSRLASGPPLRNSTVTTIAPTGSISLIAGCSSGIEPIYALAYYRMLPGGKRSLLTHPLFERMAAESGIASPALFEVLAEGEPLARQPGVPEELVRVFVTSHQVPSSAHVRIQAAFQRHTDNAVSKTINLPAEANPGEVRQAYLAAFREGCKGVTVYRDRSRVGQVLSQGRAVPASACPQCGAAAEKAGGCLFCMNCGYSLCLHL